MSDQEMQFADPDWKPSQQLNTNTNPQERDVYNPQPINANYREQTQWRETPPPPAQQEGYTGLRPYAGPVPQQMQGGNFRQRPYRRRGRGPWFWIIIAIIIIAMTSGGFRSFNGPGFDHNPFNQKEIVGKPIDYTVTGKATIVINDPNGNVTVIQGQSTTDVIVQAVNKNNFFGNPNDIPVNISQDANNANLINASVPDGQQGSVDFTVTVPQGSNLQLKTDSGNINVAGVDGQMTLTTTSGVVDLTLPSNSPFHIDATTTSGSINSSDFPGVQKSDFGPGEKAIGDIGVSSQHQGTNVTIIDESGEINLHQG